MNNKLSILRLPFLLAICLICLGQTGCDKEKMDEMVAKAKKSAGEIKDKSGDVLEKAKKGASDAAEKVKTKSKETFDKAKDTATKVSTGGSNLVGANGTARITLDSPTNFPASFIRIVGLPDGTKVLQMKSYKDGQGDDSFPSFFMQGVVTQSSVDALAGQTVPCQFFAQRVSDQPVWTNADGQPVVVQFQKSGSKMTATFSNASLVNTASGSQSSSTGTLECVTLK